VTAAICLHDVVCRLHQSGQYWAIGEDEKNALRLEWYRQLVKRPEIHEREFRKKWADGLF
ncbi:MAG: hypothetical protein MI784_16355, partial [Cytophagales bacterium]|nr:hypothetical protein [Cytophagales bacterium]